MRKLTALLLLAAVILLASCGQGGALDGSSQAVSVTAESAANLESPENEAGDGASQTSASASFGGEERTPWLEDYDTFWSLIEENYALYAAAGRITGNDFAAVKEQYRPQAAGAGSAGELFEVLDACVQSFDGTGHFWLLATTNQYRSMATLYGRLADESPKCAYLYSRIHTPEAINYYGFDPAQEVRELLEDSGDRTGAQSTGNLTFRDFPGDKTAYVSIAQMTSYFDNNDGEVLHNWFSALTAKGYRDCIIDIRGNGGGDSGYWANYITGPNLKGKVSVTNYALVKGSECVSYWRAAGKELEPVGSLPLESLPALRREDLEGVTHYIDYSGQWAPDSAPLYSGRFWLLVDGAVYSSSEMFAAFCKDTGFAVLVGEPTGGDGIGEDPLLFALPNSGICFRFSAEEGLNADGSCNEECGTQPDIVVGSGEDALDLCLKAIRNQNQ